MPVILGGAAGAETGRYYANIARLAIQPRSAQDHRPADFAGPIQIVVASRSSIERGVGCAR
jgi:hypothetical protein